jgi:hypothetical protein
VQELPAPPVPAQDQAGSLEAGTKEVCWGIPLPSSRGSAGAPRLAAISRTRPEDRYTSEWFLYTAKGWGPGIERELNLKILEAIRDAKKAQKAG